MDLFQTTGSLPANVRRRTTRVLALVLLAVCGFVAGCGSKNASTAAAAPPTSLKGVAPVVPTGDVKGTPEQEAAKQKAIQNGPAIEAALKAQQEGQPAPK